MPNLKFLPNSRTAVTYGYSRQRLCHCSWGQSGQQHQAHQHVIWSRHLQTCSQRHHRHTYGTREWSSISIRHSKHISCSTGSTVQQDNPLHVYMPPQNTYMQIHHVSASCRFCHVCIECHFPRHTSRECYNGWSTSSGDQPAKPPGKTFSTAALNRAARLIKS